MTSCAVALVLLLDVSQSVAPAQWELQRDGHAAAFRAEEVQRIIARDGLAVTVIQFDDHPRQAIPWRVLITRDDAGVFAAELARMPRRGFGGTMTGIALHAAIEEIERAPCGDWWVVDLVTDGPGAGPVEPARMAAEAAGVRINGLMVETAIGVPGGVGWMREHVVTNGGFALRAEGWGEFASALRRKLVMELAER